MGVVTKVALFGSSWSVSRTSCLPTGPSGAGGSSIGSIAEPARRKRPRGSNVTATRHAQNPSRPLKHANPLQFAWLLAMMTLGVVMRISAFSLAAVLRAVMSQQHFVNGMLDGFVRRLRRDKITIRMPVPSAEPPDTPVIRLLRWLGA